MLTLIYFIKLSQNQLNKKAILIIQNSFLQNLVFIRQVNFKRKLIIIV